GDDGVFQNAIHDRPRVDAVRGRVSRVKDPPLAEEIPHCSNHVDNRWESEGAPVEPASQAMICPDAPGASLASIFEEQAARYPDRIAVISGETRLTYRALNQAANRIAQIVLAHRGPGEATVALLFRPGPSIVTAILGVLKAGKIYVALDPTYPQPRTAYMLADSEARLLLTDTRPLALAGELAKDGQDVVDCDAIDPSTVTANLSEGISGTTPAFGLFTSGRRGPPKGCSTTTAMCSSRSGTTSATSASVLTTASRCGIPSAFPIPSGT